MNHTRTFLVAVSLSAMVLSGCTYFQSKETNPITEEEAEAKKEEVYAEGIEHFEAQKFAEAIAKFDEVIKMDPSFTNAYLNRGTAYGHVRQHDLALADFNSVIEMEPNAADAYFNRGIIYAIKGDNEKALADYNKTLEINGGAIQVYLNRGIIYKEMNELGKAIADFDKSIEFNPEDPRPHEQKAQILEAQGNEAAAIESFKTAAQLGSPLAKKWLEDKSIPFELQPQSANETADNPPAAAIDISEPDTEN